MAKVKMKIFVRIPKREKPTTKFEFIKENLTNLCENKTDDN
jgi:hypothetical protein